MVFMVIVITMLVNVVMVGVVEVRRRTTNYILFKLALIRKMIFLRFPHNSCARGNFII
jgi:hypothetical protein